VLRTKKEEELEEVEEEKEEFSSGVASLIFCDTQQEFRKKDVHALGFYDRAS